MSDIITNNQPKSDKRCPSQLKAIPVSFTWKIYNFSLRTDDKEYNPVEVYTVKDNGENSHESRWDVRLYKKKYYGSCHSAVAMQFGFWCSTVDHTINIQVSILDNKLEKTNIRSLECSVHRENTLFLCWSAFIDTQKLGSDPDRLLPENTLTISMEGFVTFGEDYFDACGNSTFHFKVPEYDVTICVGDEKIQAHKALLAAQSTVFSDIFKENDGKMDFYVTITDVKPEVMHEMVRFFYTSKAPNVYKMAGDLLAAADKYKIGKLKAICAGAMLKTLSIHNALDTYSDDSKQ